MKWSKIVVHVPDKNIDYLVGGEINGVYDPHPDLVNEPKDLRFFHDLRLMLTMYCEIYRANRFNTLCASAKCEKSLRKLRKIIKQWVASHYNVSDRTRHEVSKMIRTYNKHLVLANHWHSIYELMECDMAMSEPTEVLDGAELEVIKYLHEMIRSERQKELSMLLNNYWVVVDGERNGITQLYEEDV